MPLPASFWHMLSVAAQSWLIEGGKAEGQNVFATLLSCSTHVSNMVTLEASLTTVAPNNMASSSWWHVGLQQDMAGSGALPTSLPGGALHCCCNPLVSSSRLLLDNCAR